MTQPEYLSQGVNYLGFLSEQLGDLRGITTLAHELIQNADDAKDDAGKLSATRITFDLKDDALIVSNDAVFRKTDFERIRNVASGSKRDESGDRTTGAFGVGFVSVYQVTDRPEIQSAGQRWILCPEERENQRIKLFRDSYTDEGTVFRLPWAFEDSQVRRELKVPPVDRESIDLFADELKDSLPKAIMFLKKLDTIELRRNGKSVRRVTRVAEGNDILVDCDGVSQVWRIIQGHFSREASQLKSCGYIEDNRSDHVQVAIQDSFLDDGLLFATLPTNQVTRLPFHVNADFFPVSDRKSILFEDSYDNKSEWNRAAIRTAASVVASHLIPLRDMFKNDALTFWTILNSLRHVCQEHANDRRKPFAAFWEALLPSLRHSPIVYAESGKWLKPSEIRIPTGDKEKKAVPAFKALGIETVHRDLRRYRNILTSGEVNVRSLSIKEIYESLRKVKLVGHAQPIPSDFQTPERLDLLWKGIDGVLENTQGQSARQEAKDLLSQSALAPGLDGRLWPCSSVYQADTRTRKLFANLIPDEVSFLLKEDVPLLKKLCPQFTPRSAVEQLERLDPEHFQTYWRDDSLDPATLLKWFDTKKAELSEDEELRRSGLKNTGAAG